MRSTTAGELTTLAALERTVTWRVKIANGSGTMIDLSSWVERVRRNEDVDQPVAGATVELTRANGVLQTLSTLRTDSTLNRLDDGITYGPQIDLVRAITIEMATTPIGKLPSGADFKLKFKGSTATVNFASSPILVDCRDEGGLLVDRWVETKKLYGSGPGVALETVMQSIHDDVLGVGVVPVWTPVSPSYLISPAYQQQYESVMDADVALAQNPGWDVRYRWDDGTVAFRFKLSQPDRTKTVPDFTFLPSGYYDVTTLELTELDVRNVVIVEYKDVGDLGNRKTITVFDSASITKYRRRPLIMIEDDNSPINTASEATTMANAALADLKDPKAEVEIVLPFFWPAELGDLYRFSANGVHSDTDQDWAVVSVTDDLSPGKHETRIKVRGKPTGQYLTWLSRGGTMGGPGGVGSGTTAKPPVPFIQPLNTEIVETAWNLRFFAVEGSGGGGTNLTYTIKLKKDFGSQSTLDSGNASALPKDLSVVRDPKQNAVLTFSVTDAATGMTAEATYAIPAYLPFSDSSGQILSSGLSTQGSIIPTPTIRVPFSYGASGPGAAGMSMSWTWSAFTIYKPDGTTISVGASSGLATPPSPTLSQVAGGALGSRTRYVRLGYVKNNMVYHIGAEASLLVNPNFLLKVTSPGSVAGYSGYVVLVGSASNGEWFQLGFPIAFGTDWTEAAGGATLSGCPYNNTQMPNAVTSTFLDPSTLYYFYPWWDIAAGFVAFPDGGNPLQQVTGAAAQNADGRISLSAFTGMTASTPAGAGTGSGTGTNGGGKFL